MWPLRPEKLSDVFSHEELQRLLELGEGVGSALTLVEGGSGGEFTSLDPVAKHEERQADPFCTFFRHGRTGGKTAFEGADGACAQCEQKLARRLLAPGNAPPLPVTPGGTTRLRCHMGLTDYQVPVQIDGKTVASLIAGRRVEADEDRQRIRKIVGKLGKLTRAEAESADSSDRIVIQPADEKARDRLLQEIASIPLSSEDLEHGLAALGKLFSRLASRQFEGERRAREDALVEKIDGSRHDLPRSFGDLRRDASLILDMVRGELGFEYLAFFAMTPKELDDSAARASLIAESGLQLNTGRRLLELEWGKLPPEPAGARSDITRGLDAVSATINAVCVTRDTPADLKNKLTKCLFFSPVEMASHLRAAIIFGPARSGLDPNDSDYRFLARLGRAITRRYYALASEMERQWLSSRLSSEEKARKESESACRELEKTEGFTYFDARKLVDNCLERVKPALEKGGVELDSRALLERLTVRGDRPEIGAALRQILLAALDRTGAESGSKKASPVRVFLRRTRSRMIFGVEVIGDFLHPSERRRLFEEPEKVRAPQAATEGGPSAANGSQKSEEQGSGETPATPGASGSFSGVLATVRRHEGRFHIESEKLHRFEGDPHRWMGKTTFIVELPLPSRPERQREEKEDSKSESGRIG